MEKCRLLQAFGISIKHLKPVSNARIDALEAISDRNKEMPVEYEKDKRLTPTAYSKPQTEHIIIGNRRKKVYLTSSK